jgi:dynactin complex subunit
MRIGDKVSFKNLPGVVRFIGETRFADGVWVGVELNTPSGKNNGVVDGVKYFECQDNHGIFIRESALESGDTEVKRLTNIISKLQSRSKSMRLEIDSLNTKVLELEQGQANLVEELELSTIDKETLHEQNELLSQEIGESKKLNSQFLAKIDDIENELKLHSNSIKPGSIESISLENSKLMNELNTLEKRNLKLENDLKALTSKLAGFDDLQSKYAALSQELLKSNHVIKELSSSLEDNKQSSSVVENLTLQNISLAEENNSLKDSIKELEDLKRIENELDNETEDLIRQLNKQISQSSHDIENKDRLIESLKSKIKDLQTKAPVTSSTTTTATATLEDHVRDEESHSKIENLELSLKKLQNDRSQLSLDVEYLKFKVAFKEQIIKDLIPDLEKKANYNSIMLQNFHTFFQTLNASIKLDNKDLLIDLICVKIRFQLQTLGLLINQFQEPNNFEPQVIIPKIDSCIKNTVELLKDGDYSKLVDSLNYSIQDLEKIAIDLKNFDFHKRQILTKSVNLELSSLNMILAIIELFNGQVDLSSNFARLFKILKKYEALLIPLMDRISSAKTKDQELATEYQFEVIDIDMFFSDLTRFAATGSGLDDIKDRISDMVTQFEARASILPLELEWKDLIPSHSDAEPLNPVSKVYESEESASHKTIIEELNIKIEVLNSKLANYKQLSTVLNDYQLDNEQLMQEKSELSTELTEVKEQNENYSKIIAQSSKSLLLNNFEFDSLIEFKSKLDKVQLISEVQSLRRSIRYYSTKRTQRDYSWLKYDIPKFQPYSYQYDEIEELRKIGRDIRKKVESSRSLII